MPQPLTTPPGDTVACASWASTPCREFDLRDEEPVHLKPDTELHFFCDGRILNLSSRKRPYAISDLEAQCTPNQYSLLSRNSTLTFTSCQVSTWKSTAAVNSSPTSLGMTLKLFGPAKHALVRGIDTTVRVPCEVRGHTRL